MVKLIIMLYERLVVLLGLVISSLNALTLSTLPRLVPLALNLLLGKLLELIRGWRWRAKPGSHLLLILSDSLDLSRLLLETEIDLISVQLLELIIQMFGYGFLVVW